MQTIDSIIQQAHQRLLNADVFYGHGSDNAWDEAVYLVLAALERPLDSDRSILQEPVSEAEQLLVEQWLQRRIDQHEPLPYIMGKAYFMGMPFIVDPRVLIPRSLIAPWLADGCQPWLSAESVSRVLEIGTGSGCIAIAAALQFEQAQVDAVDISQDALDVARQNVEQYDLSERVHLIESDVFDAVPECHYDLIISNPPYVSDDDMAAVPAEYKHEPSLALRADDEGLAIVMRILREAPAYLSDHGVLFMEVGYSDETMIARFPDAPFVWLDTDADTSGLFVVTKQDLQSFLQRLDDITE